MLAELTLLLHEMSDSLRGRVPPTIAAPHQSEDAAGEPVVIVTGLASPGKVRLVAALERSLRPGGIAVHSSTDERLTRETSRLHVHAETDLEAMVEGGLPVRNASRGAEVIVPVDWEPVENSVNRVLEALIARGLTTAAVGA